MDTQIRKIGDVVWFNISNPELLEVRKLLSSNGLNESLAEEIVEPSLNAKVDSIRNAVYLTLHFPVTRNGNTNSEEIDFLIRNNVIISSQYKEVPFLQKEIEKINFTLNSHGGIYFTNLIWNIYDQFEQELKKIEQEIVSLEDNLFNNAEKENIITVSKLSGKVFDYKKSLKMHSDVLSIFKNESNKIFGFEFEQYTDKLLAKYKNLYEIVMNQKENLDEIRSTTDFLLTNKTNQIVKAFTVVSFIILPVTFLAGFFGMNTRFPTGLVNSDFGTIYIMTGMFFVSLTTVIYLHFKKLI